MVDRARLDARGKRKHEAPHEPHFMYLTATQLRRYQSNLPQTIHFDPNQYNSTTKASFVIIINTKQAKYHERRVGRLW